MAGSTGLEPAASGVTGRRSNQLNYDPDQVQSLARFSIRRRAEALASADTRTLKRALYEETQVALACEA